MIDRLKNSLKVLTASLGLVGLGFAAAPTALADEHMSRDHGPDVVKDSGDPEAASGEDERVRFPRIFAASDSDDGSGERSDERRLAWWN